MIQLSRKKVEKRALYSKEFELLRCKRKIVCTKVHYSVNYTEQNLIAIIVKKIMHILTLEYTEKNMSKPNKS